MPGGFTFPTVDALTPRFVDLGQGARGRLLSWAAWTADPQPLFGAAQTIILRDGEYQPILDGSSNGATSGGDNCFYTIIPAGAPIPPAPPTGPFLQNDQGGLITDDQGNPINVVLGPPPPTPQLTPLIDENGNYLRDELGNVMYASAN